MLNFAAHGSLRQYCYILTVYLGWFHKAPVWDITAMTEASSFDPDCQFFANSNVDRSESEGFWCTPYSQDLAQHTDLQAPFSNNDITGAGAYRSQTNLQASPDRQPSHPTSSTPSDTSSPSTKASKRQCSRCLRTFSSVSNLGKHMRTDCKLGKKQRFPCRNRSCEKELTREAYRTVHEREKCLYR
jgi:hypothetical protein